MKEREQKYYNLQDILKFLNFDYKFDNEKTFPFWLKPEEVIFDWGCIIIPEEGIERTVQNKISDVEEAPPIKELKMEYIIPFKIDSKDPKRKHQNGDFGTIIQSLSLTFRYDKTYKYGEITKSIYEVCYFILQNSIRTNNSFIITSDAVFRFFSYFFIPNQWGIGSTKVINNPNGTLYKGPSDSDDELEDDIEYHIAAEKDNCLDKIEEATEEKKKEIEQNIKLLNS